MLAALWSLPQDKFIAGLAAPIPSETQEPAPTDRTSNEQEDQILLEVSTQEGRTQLKWVGVGGYGSSGWVWEDMAQVGGCGRIWLKWVGGCEMCVALLQRLKEVERRAQELAEAQKVKAAKGRTPAVRSALEGLDPCTTPSNSLLQHAASPEELLFLLREAQKH